MITGCKSHPDELVLLVTSHCRTRATNDTLENWSETICSSNAGDLWVPAFRYLGVNSIASCPRQLQADPTWEDAKKQARANGNEDSCLLVIPGEGQCVMADYDSEATTIPAVRGYVKEKMGQLGSDGVYQGMFQLQALCQGGNNETVCPQAALNGNVSKWLAQGEFWHSCPSGADCGAAHGNPVNVLGVKDVCSLGTHFAPALYLNTSVKVTKADQGTCAAVCGGQQSHLKTDDSNLSYAERVDCEAATAALEYGTGLLKIAESGSPGINSTHALETLHAAFCRAYPLCTVSSERRYFDAGVGVGRLSDNPDPKASMTLWVSPTGNDGNSGTTAGSPLRTIAHAVALSRGWWKQNTGLVMIRMMGGTYVLNETLILQPDDSHLSFMADGVEAVTKSGGVPLGRLNWTQHGDGVVSARIPPSIMAQGRHSTSLFAGRERLTRARYPNGNAERDICLFNSDGGTAGCPTYLPPPQAMREPPKCVDLNWSQPVTKPDRSGCCAPGGADDWCLNPSMAKFHATGFAPPPELETLGFGPVQTPMGNCPYAHAPQGFSTNSSYPGWTDRAWSDASTGIVHMFHGNRNRWGGWQFALKNLTVHDDKEVEAYFSHGGWQEGRGNSLANSFYVENIREELDESGEYFLDTETVTLFLNPRPGDDLDLLVAPALEVLFHLNGTDSEPVTDVSIEGLQFAHTETVFMKEYEYPLGSDWALRRSAAVVLENAESCSVNACIFDRVGGNGVLLSRNTRDCSITRNEIARPGESGVLLLGNADSVRVHQTTTRFR